MKYMSSRGFDVKMASAAGPEVPDVVDFEGVEHYTFNLTRRITPFQDLVAIIRLRGWLRRECIDIVHSHTPKAGLVAMLASWLALVPVRLHTVAGYPWTESNGLRRLLLKSIDKMVFRLSTRVYFNSERLKEFTIKEGMVSLSKAECLANGSSNGIDTDFFKPDSVSVSKELLRVQMDIDQDARVFCFVGRVVRDKGIQELTDAFTEISKASNCYLIIVGPLEQSLDPLPPRTLSLLENNEKIRLVGYQSDVRKYLKVSDILVFPSYREGFPNVPMQAGAMGLPSIVTDINGCNEIVKEGENGLIVPPKDGLALLKAMKSLVSDRALFGKLSDNSRRMIVERYNQLTIWQEIESEYIELTKGRANV